MNIEIPKLSGTGCVLLTACGEVDEENVGALEYLKQQPNGTRVFRIASEETQTFVKLLIKGSQTHWHVDVAIPEHFSSGAVPVSERGMTELQKAFDPVAGTKLRLRITANFKVPFDKNPPIIGLLRKLGTEKDGVAIRMTGGTFAVAG